MKQRKKYPTDVTDKEWEIIRPFVEVKKAGRPRDVDLREIINALFYTLQTGCSWRMMPHDLPIWQTVYWYFVKWSKDGTFERINDGLRREVRITVGKDPDSSMGIADSQSVKMSYQKGEKRLRWR